MKGRTKEALDAFEGQLKGSNETWRYTLAAFRSLLRVGEAGKADHLLQKRMVGFSRTQVLSEALKTLFVLLEEEQVDSSVRDSIVSLGDSYVKELLAIQPYDFWYQTQAAELQILAGNQKKALKMYLDFLRETPWVPGLANNLAYLYSKADTNLGEAMQLVRKAQEGEPSHSAFYLDTEGWVLFKQGKLEEAEKQIQRAINRSHLGFGDALSESIYHLGIVQLARGNKDRAQQTFAIAGFLDPYGEYGQLARAELRKLTADPFNMQ